MGPLIGIEPVARRADGSTVDLTTSATWTSSAMSVAGVSNATGSQGLVTGLSAGTASIAATFAGVSGSASVTVTRATLVSIAVSPANPSVPAGTALPLRATATYSDGSMVDVSTQVTWSTGNPAALSVSNAIGSQGTVTALTVGSATVTATLGAVSGSTTVTVTGATLVSVSISPADPTMRLGDRLPMTATGTYSDGTTLDLSAQAIWSTGNASVVAVSNQPGTRGLVTATGLGTTTVSRD